MYEKVKELLYLAKNSTVFKCVQLTTKVNNSSDFYYAAISNNYLILDKYNNLKRINDLNYID